MRLMRMPSRVRRQGALLATIGLLAVAGAARRVEAAGPPTRHVLFLNSYHHGYEWSDALVEGMQNVLNAQPYPVEFWVEDMDTRRVSGAAYESQFEALLRFKYGQRPLDAIVAADDAALAFLLARNDDVFATVPVVFMGINNADLIARATPSRYTGLAEMLRTGDIVDLATTLRPSTRRIIVIGDATATAAAQLDAYRAVAAARRELTFVELDGARMSIEQIVEKLRETSEADAIVTTAFSRDLSGRYFTPDEALSQIAAAASAPVYSASVSQLGQGLLAGSENQGLRHSQRAARMVVAILNGRSPGNVPREKDDSPRFVIDYAQAVRWDIPESRLPANAVFVNRPESYYQAHRTAIWGVAVFMLLQAAVIGALVVNIGRRRAAEKALAAQAEHLAATNADLEQLNVSLRREIDERQHAEEQLRQAQKIDAIGRLAGGVAHDFNNLLTVIGSYTDILIETLSGDHQARPFAEQIRQATERAAGLTHQLLAFSRKQVMQPRVVDLNAVVSALVSMLRRLIGEDIELVVRLSEEPATVVVDAGQFEQVVVNLAANGRDAMPDGGQLIIETRTVVLDEEQVAGRPGMTPGVYVQVIVTDSGQGMDAQTQARVFEPFFTTKRPGEGTGLGLSTVYGVVKQSGGWIWVYSEPGHGTTFKIYLPSTDAPVSLPVGRARPARRASTGETILLVEDQDDVRELTARVLRREGYAVLEAASGAAAVAAAASHEGPIHLLLTDVVMPGLSGRQVAEQLSAARPEMRVLFMSGYTDNVIAQRGVLEAGTAFLSKPFTPDALAEKVRGVLSA